MIYVYQSKDLASFRVVKGAHAHNAEWEQGAAMRIYHTTEEALKLETDFRVREALRDIHLDEITATRRQQVLRPAASKAEQRRRDHK